MLRENRNRFCMWKYDIYFSRTRSATVVYSDNLDTSTVSFLKSFSNIEGCMAAVNATRKSETASRWPLVSIRFLDNLIEMNTLILLHIIITYFSIRKRNILNMKSIQLRIANTQLWFLILDLKVRRKIWSRRIFFLR